MDKEEEEKYKNEIKGRTNIVYKLAKMRELYIHIKKKNDTN